MEKIDQLLEENRANSENHNCKLNFEVHDRDQNLKLALPSKSLRINPNNKFLEQIRNLNIVDYKLN
ncbi:hypothetical protein D9M68_765630 [compost metagenome]